MIKLYSPVGRGVALLRPQGSVSYVQSDEETYNMDRKPKAKKRKAPNVELGYCAPLLGTEEEMK